MHHTHTSPIFAVLLFSPSSLPLPVSASVALSPSFSLTFSFRSLRIFLCLHLVVTQSELCFCLTVSFLSLLFVFLSSFVSFSLSFPCVSCCLLLSLCVLSLSLLQTLTLNEMLVNLYFSETNFLVRVFVYFLSQEEHNTENSSRLNFCLVPQKKRNHSHCRSIVTSFIKYFAAIVLCWKCTVMNIPK